MKLNLQSSQLKWIFFAATFTIVLAFVGCSNSTSTPPGAKVQAGVSSDEDDHEHEHGVELVLLMGRMQLFMNKLYFAGTGNNPQLRDFYVHEMEEIMEEIAEGEVMHEGVNISQNMKMYGVAQLEAFEEALEAGKDFTGAYNGLVNACNSCHTASKYPFIIIKEPTKPVFDNQVYSAE